MSISSPDGGGVDPQVMARRLLQTAHTGDGLPEMAIGGFFLLCALLEWAQAALPPPSMAARGVALTLGLLIPLVCFALPSAIRLVRRRYLIQRFGYVRHQPVDRRQIGLGIGAVVVVAAVLFGVVPRLSNPDTWLLAGTGLAGGALAAWCGRQTRFVIGGFAFAAAGIALAFSGVTLLRGFALLFGFQGLLSLISGSLVLRRFLRQPRES